MTRRGGREQPAAISGRGLAAFALALAVLAPGAAEAAPPKAARVHTIYHKSRSFRIPFNVDPADRPRLKEVQLWVSEDSGYRWKTVSRTTPDRPAFTFRASHDGEFWFAVRTLDSKGVLYPAEDEKVEPSMKVVVDSVPPSLVLEPDGRRGSLASVRWEVRDEQIDLKSLVLEYQVEGGRDWRTVPVHRPARIGSENWDAGTAEPLKVRGSVSDRAGNLTEAVIGLPEGTPTNPGFTPGGGGGGESTEFSSPPVSQISSGPTFPATVPARSGARSAGPLSNEPIPWPPTDIAAPTASSAPDDSPDAFVAQGSASAQAPAPEPTPPAPAGDGGGSSQAVLVASPRFPLQYEVKDAGPGGPAAVELWVTQDGGRTWFRKGDDPDRTSPFPVDLGGEGTYGLRLVSRAGSGVGEPTPAPGEAPDMVVEVDSSAPAVQMLPPALGSGAHLGKVQVRWKATDVHLGPKPVVISWRPDQPGARWQTVAEGVENTGQFVWSVPTSVPARFQLRVDVVDTAGNRGYAETAEGAPVVLERTRPRSRIIGLDPSARAGLAPGGRQLR